MGGFEFKRSDATESTKEIKLPPMSERFAKAFDEENFLREWKEEREGKRKPKKEKY